MITYLYWFVVLLVSATTLWLGIKLRWPKTGVGVALAIISTAWGLNHFYLEQFFVKNLGGVMAISVPAGQVHIHTTWKDDHLWVENYDPKTNICYFSEYSRRHLLEGQVAIENCNPIGIKH